MKIDIKAFARRFYEEYTALYDREDGGFGADGFYEAVDAFDSLNEMQYPLIWDFEEYRGDIVTSDREAAAFMFALAKMVQEVKK